jgi:hypothetical protein
MKRQRDFSKIAKLENGCVRERERERERDVALPGVLILFLR